MILSSTAFRIALGKKWIVSNKFAFSLEFGFGGGGTPLQFGTEFKL